MNNPHQRGLVKHLRRGVAFLGVLIVIASADCASLPVGREAGNRAPSIEKTIPSWTFDGGG